MYSSMQHRVFLLIILFGMFAGSVIFAHSQGDCFQIVVVGDPHLPGSNLEAKTAMAHTINSWSNVDLVVCTGDVTKKAGTVKEYEAVRDFFAGLRKPLAPVIGNHDYFFSDKTAQTGIHFIGSPAERSEHINRFLLTFNLPREYYSREIPGYHLVFLSANDLTASGGTQLSEDELRWLEWDLYHNADKPTVIFCHAPIWNPEALAAHPRFREYMAAPLPRIMEILERHQQVFLWVAGHMHMTPENPFSSGPNNVILGRVQVINNCDLDIDHLSDLEPPIPTFRGIWTTSLLFYENHVVAKIFDHKKQKWLRDQEKTIPRP